MNLLSIDAIAFTFLGYPMSYIELVGTLLYLWSVWLIARRNILTWPIGIVSVVLYMLLFYQIQLYSDVIEQIYYLGASAYGWWLWGRSPQEQGKTIGMGFSPRLTVLITIGLTVVLSLLAGRLIADIHTILPRLFPAPASFPYLDALTTVMSFVAMWLMARRRTESWYYWIVVNVIGIGLYYAKDVKLISLLYVILLVLAFRGLIEWRRTQTSSRSAAPVAQTG